MKAFPYSRKFTKEETVTLSGNRSDDDYTMFTTWVDGKMELRKCRDRALLFVVEFKKKGETLIGTSAAINDELDHYKNKSDEYGQNELDRLLEWIVFDRLPKYYDDE